jgi:hypothetical protein
MEEKSIVLSNSREITPAVWQMVKEMAPVMHQARMFGVTSPEAAAATMIKGYEIGLGFAASFEFIKVIQGHPELIPRGALALIHNSPAIKSVKIERIEKNGKFQGYACTMTRVNGFEYTATWTLEDAQRAGLVKPDSGWAHYPENMCLWRAVGFAADVVAPDVVSGMTGLMKMPERYGVALSEEGDVIDMEPVSEPVQVTTEVQPEVKPQQPAFTLEELVDIFGAEAVLVANSGIIPGTTEEVQAVAVKLAGGVK